MRTVKIKVRNFVILFFSLILTLAVFSQLEVSASASKTQTTSDVVWVDSSDYFYSKTSNDNLSAYLGKKGSNVPTIRYQKDNHFLEFSMNQVSSTTAVSLETNSKEPNTPTLFYRNIAEDIDATYKITNLPFKVKEEIVLRKNPTLTTKRHPMSFGGENLTFLFDADTTAIPVKQKDGSIYFYDNQNNYLFQIDKPFMIDGKGTRSEEVSIEIVPVKSPSSPSSPSSHKVKNNFQFPTRLPDGQVFNFQSIFNNPIFKPITSSFSSLKIKYQTTSDVVWRQNTITLSASSDWLNDPSRVYPVIIDPTITHSADADFAGTLNRISDTDTTATPKLEAYYQESAADPYTVGLWHFDGNTNDSSGKAHNGTLVDTATVSGATQFMGNVLTLDGAGDCVSVPDDNDFEFGSGDFTIDFWVNFNSLPSDTFFFYTHGVANEYLSFHLDNNNKLRFDVTSGIFLGDYNMTNAKTWATGRWYHIALVRSGPTIYMFIDGVSQALTVSTAMATTIPDFINPISIGAIYGCSTLYLNGFMEEFRVTKGRALTTEEIKAAASRRPYAVYTSPVLDATVSVSWDTLNWTEGGVRTGDGETLYNSSGLVAQWNFNETSGTTADNAEGTAALDGTLTNFASTASQDQAAGTGWTANNKKWGAGALMMESAASADYVSVTDPASNVLDPNSADLTIETWIKTFDTSAEIFSNNNANGTACTNNGYYLGIDASGYPVFYLDTNGATAGCDASITSQFKINDGNWHNIAVSVTRGTSAVIYVDGKAAGSDTSVTSYSAVTVTGNVYFGGSAGGLDAIADSTRFYSRALSAAEILSNYNASNIEIQTRTGATTDPNDGTWEAWKPTTGETQLLSMDSDAVNWHSDIMASTTIATSTDTVIKAEGTGSLKIKMGMASTTANTVALWHFEETGTSTGTYLYDETANNNDATTTGTTVVDGIFGKARRFNGTSDYVEVSNENSFDFTTGGFTLGSWINLSYTNGTGKIIMAKYCDAACAELSYRFQVNGSNQLEILVSDVPGSNYILKYTTQALIPGQWYYAIATYNGGTTAAAFKLYLNGLEITNVGTGGAGTYTSMGNIAQPLRIGAAKSSGSIAYYFPGIIDEPFVSTRILSPDEIAETYRMGANRHLTRQVSSTDLSGANKLPFYVAADRTGTYLEAMIGESDYANYELASSTLALSTATVLYIKGDEIASSTSIKDSSFSGKAITANGDAKIAGGGKIGNSVYFDGAGDYLTIPDSDDWNIGGGDFAIDFWVRLTSFASENGLLMQFTDTGNFMRVFYYSDGILQYNVWSGGGNNSNVLKTTSALSLGVWTHVALVKSGTATTWYINGQSSGSKVMTYDWGNYTETLQIGRQENELSAFYYLTGYLDELRIIKGTALTPDQIRQAYEYGLRSHPITIDFGATLQTSDLISSATDYNFSLTATTSGLSATTSGLYLGDKIIIKENLGGTEYTAQGTVNAINANTGAITVPSWDSGSTFPSGNGYSPAATVFKWQREYFDLTGSLSTHRDAVTNLTLRPTNGASGRTIYLDDFRYNTNYLTASSSSAITSSNNRYLQYRTIFTSTDTYVSPFLSALSTLYTSLAAMFPPVIGISGGGFLSF